MEGGCHHGIGLGLSVRWQVEDAPGPEPDDGELDAGPAEGPQIHPPTLATAGKRGSGLEPMRHTRGEMNDPQHPRPKDDAAVPQDGEAGVSETESPAGPDAPAAETDEPMASEAGPARRAIERIRSSVAAAREPLVGRVSHAVGDVERTWNERPGARVRRVRRMASLGLPYLYDVQPEARSARPVEVGFQTIDIADIAGTAVGGGQRGGDFLPLKPSRTTNWAARWQRLRKAYDNLAVLPPIDVVKNAGKYWIVDGHNRVAMALYNGQVAIDANVVELVPLGGRRTEPISSLATSAEASRALRTAGSGQSPSHALTREDAIATDGPDDGG